MQQTEKYKLNLIETSDTFSPNPLNENAQKLETQLSAEAAARESAVSGLSSRITVLEGHRFATGAYTGTGSEQTFSLGFTPIAVIAFPYNNVPYMAVTGASSGNIQIVDGGFKVSNYLCRSGSYCYLAIL